MNIPSAINVVEDDSSFESDTTKIEIDGIVYNPKEYKEYCKNERLKATYADDNSKSCEKDQLHQQAVQKDDNVYSGKKTTLHKQEDDTSTASSTTKTPEDYKNYCEKKQEQKETTKKDNIQENETKFFDRINAPILMVNGKSTTSAEWWELREKYTGSVINISNAPKENLYQEPILTPNTNRYCLHPIQHHDLWNMYKKAQACFWVPEELDFKYDYAQWNSLTKEDQHFLKLVLAFFATADGIVTENLAANFVEEVQLPEAKAFYTFQIAMETIHAETYSLLLKSFVTSKTEQEHLFNAIKEIKSIKNKAQWALTWCDRSKAYFAERCVAFAVVEGIFFSSSFCAIFWLKKRGIMSGLCQSNELIARDEGLHCDFACMIYKKLQQKLNKKRMLEIITSAVQIEQDFAKEALPTHLLGMNVSMMSQYIEFCADRLLFALGHRKHYGSQNPFPWMVLISLQGKSNFFEQKVSKYAKANVGSTHEDRKFSLDTKF